MSDPLFADWQGVIEAPRSAFFSGHTADTVFDRTVAGTLSPNAESLFTQSNARILIGQASNGTLRFAALPTQVYPVPTATRELGYEVGMYHHFDVAMYAGDLSYSLLIDGSDAPIDLAADARDNQTWYADHFLPLTRTQVGDLDVSLVSLAPVAPDPDTAPLSPAPLPGPAGALYVLTLKNTGSAPISGKVLLQASDMLVGRYDDAQPHMRALAQPELNLRQQTLILSRPEGSVGVHLHVGTWSKLDAPFQAERPFSLQPGQQLAIETHIALGASYSDILPTIYQLHMRSALDWLNLTAAFWRDRLGLLEVDAFDFPDDAHVSRDLYLRAIFDNFNCLQTDADGNLVSHWQGAPSHGYGTIWGIDVEPTAVSIAHVCPELARRVLEFFMTRSRAPVGAPEHSVPILVAPIIIARKWLELTGDIAFFRSRPDVMQALRSIMDHLLHLQAPSDTLFPSHYSSDGPVGRRYDYGTNVKVWYTCDSFAFLLRQLDRPEQAAAYSAIARGIQLAIDRHMMSEGPFGPQISGGTNLGEDPGTLYLPEGVPYYDGEDTSSMLAPIYGICDFDHQGWINYHRFARSLWCPNFDPEFGILRWGPGEFGVLDGTALFSRLSGSITRTEMHEAMDVMRRIGLDDVTGSVFWWPRGVDLKRGLTRCSQGQGAWVWQYLQQWIGLRADCATHTLTIAPRGLLTACQWQGCALGPHRFDIRWEETDGATTAWVRNLNDQPWRLQAGFRQPGAGAEGRLAWQGVWLDPGCEVALSQSGPRVQGQAGIDSTAVLRAEVKAFGDDDGVLLKRFGQALLWGNWDGDRLFEPQEMPLTVRLIVLNGTAQDWRDVSVVLVCPEGWQAQGRRPMHWDRATTLSPGAAAVELGVVPAMGAAVAPFWIAGPYRHTLTPAWQKALEVSFHAPSQPGPGLTISSAEVSAPTAVTFQAELRAVASDGSEIRKQLAIPVQVVHVPG